jgi:soluble lytic murein transglycosylase-like protein
MADIAGVGRRPPTPPPNQQFAVVVAAASPTGGVAPGVARSQVERLASADAAAWSVDPALIEAIVANESGFDARATSSAGARGLMQLMPATAAGLGVTNAYDPAQNVWAGTRYLRGLLDRFGGNVELAVAAYNAGPGAVEKYGGVPPYAETRNYVRAVAADYERYRARAPLRP